MPDEKRKDSGGGMFESEWMQSLGRDRVVVREREPSPFDIISVSSVASIAATFVWAVLLSVAQVVYVRAHPAQFPPPVATLLPYSLAPAVALIPLGARFRDAWWPAGFVAALVQVPCGFAFAWLVLFAAMHSHLQAGPLFAVALPAPFYPLATYVGAAGARLAPRPWMFWVAYGVVVAITVLAVQWTAARS